MLRDYVRGDALLSRHFDVFLFEDQPAQSRSPHELYLDEVDGCAVYVALLGLRYGFEDSEGISPTEREFDRAVVKRKHRLVFVKDAEPADRQAKILRLIEKAERQITRRRFVGIPDLTAHLYRSLVKVLEDDHVLVAQPFDSTGRQLSLNFIDDKKLEEFTDLALRKRGFRLKHSKNKQDTLIQLSLFTDDQPNNAAFLLFSDSPKRAAPGAEIKCLHYAGVEPLRPALSHQVYSGSLFDQADSAVAFVMDRLASAVGVRSQTTQVPTDPEIPRAAVTEAVLNAIAHRDYTSTAGVQITVLADRVEIANPGELPRGLTPEQLRHAHSSIPRNPLIAEALFLSGYIDKAGTGTLEIIHACREAGLPEPGFEQRGDQWTVTLWRDWLTASLLSSFGLNDRQMKAVIALKATTRIDNSAYQALTGSSDRTAARDLKELIDKGILSRVGAATGRGASYERARSKPAINPPNPPRSFVPEPSPKTSHKPAKPAKPPRRNSGGKAGLAGKPTKHR